MSDNPLATARREYTRSGLTESDLPADPFELFARWYADAADIGEPNAMVVATVDPDGAPSSRMVLLKEVTGEGFTFFTNQASRKGRAIEHEARVALLFPWHPLERQVRIEGVATMVPRADVDAYFAVRPRGAQIGAWASPQSEVVDGRDELDRRYAEAEERFADGPVPSPPHWGGYLVTPTSFEFWQGRPGRMHDRLVFERFDAGWSRSRLAP